MGTPLITWGSTITKEYCQTLIDSAKKEQSQKNYSKAIEIFLKIKELSELNGWMDIKIYAINNIGVVFHNVSDYKQAMDYYMEAYQLVLNEPNMEIYKARILNNIAVLYEYDEKYDMATDYYQKALLISQYIRDTTVMIGIFNNLGSIANKLNKMDLAIQYTDSTLKLSQDIPLLIQAKQIKALALYQKQEYHAAEKLVLETFRQIQVHEIGYQQMLTLILLTSKIYQAQSKEKEALSFIQKAMDYSSSLSDIISIYEQMAILYQKNQQPDLALAYKDSVIVLKDSLHKINAFIDIENSYIRIELLNSERELSENKAKQKAERLLFMVVVAAIFVLAVILIWILRIQSIRNRQRKQITELELEQEKSRKLILEQEMKEKETASLLERERLNNEINTKNKQITAKILSQTNNNELIKELIKDLTEASSSKENPMLEAIIRKLKMQLSNSLEWNSFLAYFEQINPALLESLQRIHPNLSVNNLQLLSCIYLNLDTKKIAYLLNISPEACRKKKQRLAHKMNIHVTEIYDYIADIAKSSL